MRISENTGTDREGSAMEHFKQYEEALRRAYEEKRLYLAEAVRDEERYTFEKIDLADWSMQERQEQYQDLVLPYWQKFGRSPERFWFEYYGSRDHKMDPRFIPADFLFTELYPYLNNGQMRPGLQDKCYFDYLFSDVKQPETVALKIEGTYYDEKRRIVSAEQAAGLCRQRGGELFLKVATGTSCSRGITVFTPSECTDEKIRGLFDAAGPDFIVQKRLRQHPALDALNPSSVSTIRVFSLLMDDQVYVESAGIRVSAPDLPFVSVHDGGFFTEILEGGKLHPKVYSDMGQWFDGGKGLFDDTFRIPSVDRLYDDIRRIHPRLGHFRCIGWDFAIDDDADPVLIEFNVFPAAGCSQMARCKPMFNDHTDRILEDYFIHRRWAENHRQDILIH